MKENIYPKTADLKFLDLCEEIDNWKQEAKFWREEYDKLNAEYHKFMNESLAASKKGIGQALLFCLHAHDDENGNLVISRDSRKVLADMHKEDLAEIEDKIEKDLSEIQYKE